MLPFAPDEFDRRIDSVRRRLAASGLDGLLIFAQESHYYLTGFESGGYKHFQCAVLTTVPSPITLLTRRPDLQQARRTSTMDAEGRPPDWANNPKLIPVAEGFLRNSMRRGDTLMLAGWVTSLRERGVDVGPMYERVRREFPEIPTLAELDEKIAARAR